CLIQVVKEQFRLSLSSQPRPRILQQPFYLSSCFSKNFFFLLNNLALQLTSSSSARGAFYITPVPRQVVF
ncbi:hypothetical protein QYE80_30075, partial [Pseudomonas tohonis]|nr:hypothetical protein [Pseudomonas tohonis]